MDEMKGKVVIVTGASSGIGRAAALKFASEGASVVLVARSGDRLAEVAQVIESGGGKAHAIAADVTKDVDVEHAVRETVEAFGGIDVLVNAAGIIATGTVETTALKDWDQMMNVNVRGPFYLMQRAMPYLVERKGNVV
ncbi:MAG: SDR family NAD(P)-dependent oxidoreductase, partial [Chloroflexota bacterium]|nr:SDR family NAD(P)-dependent oxidoreductase [Chloroflexota bacterium]